METVTQAGNRSCSTVVVRGLDKQIIAQMNRLVSGALDDFSSSKIRLGQAVWPLLQPAAKRALDRAVANRGKILIVNSAYRTIAQQLILFQHDQANRCGISIAAEPGKSNHQSGLALDIEDHQGWRSFLEAQGWRWLGPSDPVHFDFNGSGVRNIGSTAILAFQQLWNQNNPSDEIGEDGDWGPATASRLGKSPASGFANGPTLDTVTTNGGGVELGDRLLQLTSPLLEGDDVRQVQQALTRNGSQLVVDGFFGPDTDKAVKAFQQQKQLQPVDGIVGPATLAALGLSPS
jgi:hypothetical protein